MTDVINYVKTFPENSKLLLLSPIHLEDGRAMEDKLKVLLQQGYARLKINNRVVRIEEAEQVSETIESIYLVVDRIVLREADEDFFNRLADAIETAFFEGKGECFIEGLSDESLKQFSNRFERDGMKFLEPNIHLFSFNNPYGACPKCEGYGDIIGIDESLVVRVLDPIGPFC